MKSQYKITALAFFLAVFAIAGCGGRGSNNRAGLYLSAFSSPSLPSSPSFEGKPIGDKVSAVIGVSGGDLVSPDNRLTISIPANALAADTQIDVQIITNKYPDENKLGSAYKLTPDGQTFLQPIQLIFSYTDDLLQGASADSLGAVFQSEDGLWNWLDNPIIDTTAKTITVMTSHFSGYTTAKNFGFVLKPQIGAVKVSKTLSLQTSFLLKGTPPDAPFTIWYVNGIAYGNSTVGTIIVTQSGNNAKATYTAPAVLPPVNPVTISVVGLVGLNARTLSAEITVVDKPAYYGYVDFFGLSNDNADGSYTTWSGSGKIMFTFDRDSGGGLIFYTDSGNSQFIINSWFEVDKAIHTQTTLVSPSYILATLNGQLTIFTGPQTYSFGAVFSNQGQFRIYHLDPPHNVESQSGTPGSILTTFLTPTDMGSRPVGDGKILAGDTEYFAPGYMVEVSWGLMKVEE